jgi:protein-tyrosine-phosphatase/DNA-binding transcriptional ArsR family regulator
MAGPAVLQALGNDLRWQIVNELSRSDLKVGELTVATGQPQNLVSYHLRLLREASLVRERRGSADGRDIYYSLDRRAVTTGLVDAITAVHPGAGLSLSGRLPKHSNLTKRATSVLFLCTGNSARSQIAEAILRQLGGRHMRVRSAGTHPVGVHPQVPRILAARGIHAGALRSKSVAEFVARPFDYVVTLCDVARTERIVVGGQPQLMHWSIPDPVAARGGRAAVSRAFVLVTDEIEGRVKDLYADLRIRESAA